MYVSEMRNVKFPNQTQLAGDRRPEYEQGPVRTAAESRGCPWPTWLHSGVSGDA